jgi:hypothetical protein
LEGLEWRPDLKDWVQTKENQEAVNPAAALCPTPLDPAEPGPAAASRAAANPVEGPAAAIRAFADDLAGVELWVVPVVEPERLVISKGRQLESLGMRLSEKDLVPLRGQYLPWASRIDWKLMPIGCFFRLAGGDKGDR